MVALALRCPTEYVVNVEEVLSSVSPAMTPVPLASKKVVANSLPLPAPAWLPETVNDGPLIDTCSQDSLFNKCFSFSLMHHLAT
jgi:hypothetical protein